jgi:hypothetical protein
MLSMPEEVAYFGRSGLFGIGLAVAYWFVSYELVGTILLGAFGLATGLLFVVLRLSVRRARASGPEPDVPLLDEGGLVPLSSVAPLEIAFGLASFGLALAYGVWFLIAGLLPIGLGAADWLAGAMREGRASSGDGA